MIPAIYTSSQSTELAKKSAKLTVILHGYTDEDSSCETPKPTAKHTTHNLYIKAQNPPIFIRILPVFPSTDIVMECTTIRGSIYKNNSKPGSGSIPTIA